MRPVSLNELEGLHTRLRAGTITLKEKRLYYAQWWRIVLRFMRGKLGRTQDCGFVWYDDRLWVAARSERKPHQEEQSEFFHYILAWVTHEASHGKRVHKSLDLYQSLNLNFWSLKGCWELTYRGGVGGVDPHTSRGLTLGKRVLDYHYWRVAAANHTGNDQPPVETMLDLARGRVEGYELTEREKKANNQRLKTDQTILELWAWFNQVLQPADHKEELHESDMV